MTFDEIVPSILNLGWKYLISNVLDVASKDNVAVLPKQIFHSFAIDLFVNFVIFWLLLHIMKFEQTFRAEFTDPTEIDILQHIRLNSYFEISWSQFILQVELLDRILLDFIRVTILVQLQSLLDFLGFVILGDEIIYLLQLFRLVILGVYLP